MTRLTPLLLTVALLSGCVTQQSNMLTPSNFAPSASRTCDELSNEYTGIVSRITELVTASEGSSAQSGETSSNSLAVVYEPAGFFLNGMFAQNELLTLGGQLEAVHQKAMSLGCPKITSEIAEAKTTRTPNDLTGTWLVEANCPSGRITGEARLVAEQFRYRASYINNRGDRAKGRAEYTAPNELTLTMFWAQGPKSVSIMEMNDERNMMAGVAINDGCKQVATKLF